MFSFPYPNKPRRLSFILPCLSIALGCLIAGRAHGAPADPKDASASNPSATSSQTSAATTQGPTYLGDVQPIFMGSCARCHNQQTRFVYNWLDYKTAYSDRWELKRRIWDSWKGTYYKEAMPVANSPESLALTDEQRSLIKTWVENGGIEGEPRPQAQGTSAMSKQDKIAHGQQLFTACAACHQPTGKGLPNVFPPLAGSDFLNADKARAIGIVIHGKQGEVVVNGQKYSNSMPPFPLSDQDIASVLTYVYNSFGNSGLEVTAEEVKAQR
jgi:mono/diheme cytochrome c family protein